MFEGIKVKGMPDIVMSRGRVLVQNNEFNGKPGSGHYLKRAQYSGV
jgi:dihydropyrimidinase